MAFCFFISQIHGPGPAFQRPVVSLHQLHIRALQILEQNYRNDPVTQDLLLSLFEGKTIQFESTLTRNNTQTRELIPGKIIRSYRRLASEVVSKIRA